MGFALRDVLLAPPNMHPAGDGFRARVTRKVEPMGLRRRLGERGAAAVEMALVMPILVLFIGGIIDFGRAFMSQVILTNAAREGTRWALYTDNAASVRSTVVNRTVAAADVDPSSPAAADFTITIVTTTTSGATSTDVGCTPVNADRVKVTVTRDFDWLLLGALPLPNTLTGTSTMGCQ
jgi:Flp pilus assembly protein TadG